MSLFASNDEKARKALGEAITRHELAVADLEAHRLAPADPGDFDARKAWAERDEALRRDVEIAAGVVEHWRGVTSKLEAEAAERALDAEHAAEEKRAATDAKLIREADALATKLADKLAEIEASRARTEAVNANRGNRAGIADAETRVRRRMDQGRPAITRTVKVWVDSDGNRVNAQAHDDHGRVFWRKDLKEVEVEEVIYPAIEPMPLPLKRLADEIRLIDIEGRQTWPRQ